MNRLISLVMTAAFILGALSACGKGDAAKVGSDAAGDSLNVAKMIDIELTSEDYGIGVDKAQPELLKQVNQFLDEIREDGTYEELENRYFGNGNPVPVSYAEEDPDRDQLVVAATLEFEPFEYGTVEKCYGFDLELAAHLADYLGKELVIVNSSFETMFMSLKQHKCDICISAITITDERREFMNFSKPYYHTAQVIIAPANDDTFDNARTPADVENILNSMDSSTVISVESLTTAQYFIQGDKSMGYKGFPVSIKQTRNSTVAVEDVAAGESDYAVTDKASAYFILDAINGSSKK